MAKNAEYVSVLYNSPTLGLFVALTSRTTSPKIIVYAHIQIGLQLDACVPRPLHLPRLCTFSHSPRETTLWADKYIKPEYMRHPYRPRVGLYGQRGRVRSIGKLTYANNYEVICVESFMHAHTHIHIRRAMPHFPDEWETRVKLVSPAWWRWK